MKFHLPPFSGIIFSCLMVVLFTSTQAQPATTSKNLFDSDDILQITLKGKTRDLIADRSDKPKSFPFELSYSKEDNSETTLPVVVKTRGHFRKMRENCYYPPMLVQFPKKGPQSNTIFSEQAKLKLVMPCKEEEYVVREWLVYKIYNLLTEKSFRARLVKVTLFDDSKNKSLNPMFGILLEETQQLAKRNKAILINRKLKPKQTQEDVYTTMCVFQYLIGNTDWGLEYLQNIKLLAEDSLGIPATVPYDFDHAGIVDAPYAEPAAELYLTSVRERRYRGYCITDMSMFDNTIAKFNSIKNDIYNLYNNCPNLSDKYKKNAIRYFDDFYKTINNPKDWQKEFSYPCDKNGTGNVVIRGLRQD